MPLIVTTAVPLMAFAGDPSYWSYLHHLKVPVGAVEFTTAERVVAGVTPMLTWAAAMCALIGGYGLLRWLSGIQEFDVWIGLVALAMSVSLVSIHLVKADDAAKTRLSGGVPHDWYGLEPYSACIAPTSNAIANEGYRIDLGKPWILLGEGHDRYVFWPDGDGYRRLPADRFDAIRAGERTSCPGR